MISNALKIDMLQKMILIREFENVVSEYKDKKYIYGSTHCYNGEEAVAVGVCSALNRDDYIISNHRPHGHAIAKGMDPKVIMAEIFGKENGSNSGKGGSMHIHDSSIGLVASSGIVGSGIPIGCGAAFAAKYEKSNRIACIFFGDGSANEGILHECLNLSSVWNLPVLFLLEDNKLAITTNTRETSACNDYVRLASAYKIKGCHVDGQEVELTYNTSVDAINYIRYNCRPFFVQAHTIRFNEHAEGEFYKRMIEKDYRDHRQLKEDRQERCPIKLYAAKLVNEHVITNERINELTLQIRLEISKCVDFAILSSEPGLFQAKKDVFREVRI